MVSDCHFILRIKYKNGKKKWLLTILFELFSVIQTPVDITVCEESDKVVSKNSEDNVKTKNPCVEILESYIEQVPNLLDFLQMNQNVELSYQYLMHTYFTVLEYCDYCTTNIQANNRVSCFY